MRVYDLHLKRECLLFHVCFFHNYVFCLFYCHSKISVVQLLPVSNGSTTDPADPMSGKDQPAKKKIIKLKALPSSELSQCMPVEVLPGMCLNHLSTASP